MEILHIGQITDPLVMILDLSRYSRYIPGVYDLAHVAR